MGTATTNRNADDIVFTNEGSWASIISTLRSYFVVGNTIQAAHLTYLRDRMNEMLGHYHNYTDAIQLATFGAGYGDNPGAGDRTNYYVSGGVNTSRSGNFSSDISTTYSAGSQVTASQHNELALRSRQLVSHAHPIVDTTSF
jgi:hypothetical protein